MKRAFTNGNWRILALCCAAFIVSCQKDDVPDGIRENRRVNDWILMNMEREYYWNDDIPANPNKDQDPMDFFESILSDKDRFSWIQESGEELSDNLSGKFESFGYEVKLYFRADGASSEDDVDDLIAAVVIYTYQGSNAAAGGLQRGMWIGRVNGEDLKESNFSDLLFNTDHVQELEVGALDAEGNFTTEQTISVQAAQIQENPVHYHNVYNYGGKKIGYLVYNSFIPSPADDTTGIYDEALKTIFTGFKGQGVNELVLDLRYNLGGSVASAIKLAGYIMKNYREDNIFAIYEDNREELIPIPVSAFYEEEETPPNLGTLDRLYVLISTNTASASELVINGLKPFMDVILIGDDRTVGKNVASITIVDNRNVPDDEKIRYGLQPIVYKIYNSQMQSDFEAGFRPDIEVQENFAPFGDVNESFLNAALNEIAGGVVTAEAVRKPAVRPGQEIGNSLRRRPGAGEMFVKPWELPSQN